MSVLVREQIVAACKKLELSGLNRGTSGNVSCREKDHFLVTPSGVAVDEITPSRIVAVGYDGKVIGIGKPSSEWHFHRDILQARPDIGAVVHTHAPHATAIACLREGLPAFHYMIAVAGGDCDTVCALCTVWYGGVVSQCGACDERPQGLPARKPWTDCCRPRSG